MRINSFKGGQETAADDHSDDRHHLFLLVFFMMSMLTMVTQKTIALNLPRRPSRKWTPPKQSPCQSQRTGVFSFEQNLVSEEELARRLVSLKTENEKLTVVLRGDEKPTTARWLALWMSSAAQVLNESP